jgi:transposase
MLAAEALAEVGREVYNDPRRQGNLRLPRDLKGARFAVWKNPENLTDRQAPSSPRSSTPNTRLYRGYGKVT